MTSLSPSSSLLDEEKANKFLATSTPVASSKFYNKPLEWDLDVSGISEILSETVIMKRNRFHVTPADRSLISLSAIYSPDFATAWNNSLVFELESGEKVVPAPMIQYEDIFEDHHRQNMLESSVVEVVVGVDCPCSFDSNMMTTAEQQSSFDEGFVTLTENTSAAVAIPTVAMTIETNKKLKPTLADKVKNILLLTFKRAVRLWRSTLKIKPALGVSLRDHQAQNELTADVGVDVVLCKSAALLYETIRPMFQRVNVYVSLRSPAERRFYKTLYLLTVKEFRDFLELENTPCLNLQTNDEFMKERFKRIADLLLYLRQYLVSPNLIQSIIDRSGTEIDEDVSNSMLVFDREFESSKLEQVYKDLRRLREVSIEQGKCMDKVVLITQFQPALELLRYQLWSQGFAADIISDDMTVPEQQFIISQFILDPESPHILLFALDTFMTTKWKMEGIQHLILLDNHWDPETETGIYEQIQSTCQSITVARYITRGTIEEIIDEIRESKLHHNNSHEANVLTRKEIFKLFGFEVLDTDTEYI